MLPVTSRSSIGNLCARPWRQQLHLQSAGQPREPGEIQAGAPHYPGAWYLTHFLHLPTTFWTCCNICNAWRLGQNVWHTTLSQLLGNAVSHSIQKPCQKTCSSMFKLLRIKRGSLSHKRNCGHWNASGFIMFIWWAYVVSRHHVARCASVGLDLCASEAAADSWVSEQ